MKKVRLLLTLVIAFVMVSGLSAQLNVLFVGEDDIPEEAELISSIEAEGHTVTRETGGTFAGMGASDFDAYDVVVIGESIDSGDATNYGVEGFPKPVVSLEPWVLHKDGWEFYAENYPTTKGEETTEDAFKMQILTDHEIFTGLDYTPGDEVEWTTGKNDDEPEGGEAHVVGTPIGTGDMAPVATPLADNVLVYNEAGADYSFMWAIEETASTPRMFTWGIHTYFMQYRTDVFDQIVNNAIQWVAGEAVSVASVDADETTGLSISPNPAIGSTELNVSTAAAGVATINVIDLSGNKVATETSNFTKGVNSHNLSVDALKSGIYFVSVEVAGNTSVEKLIVQ